MGRFKKGTDTGFIDVCTNPIFIGDVVENTINGTKGEVTTYGVVADAEGGKHKLSNQIWKVVIPYGKSEETVKEHTESLKKEALLEAKEDILRQHHGLLASCRIASLSLQALQVPCVP